MLESRENPTAYWDPLSSNDLRSLNGANWLNEQFVRYGSTTKVTVSGSELIYGAVIPAHQEQNPLYPQPGQPFWITIPAHVNTLNCILTQSTASYLPYGPPPPPPPPANIAFYNGLHFLSPYTGEVTITQSAFVNVFEMANGRLKQNDATMISQ